VSAEDRVCDDEVLYRRVPDIPGGFHKPISGGRRRVTSGAFGSREKQPSVDRAILRDNNPENSRRKPTECVVSFTAGEVRNMPVPGRSIDVVPDPNPPEDPDNSAHALIVADPPFSSNQFDKFKVALAGLADSRWEIAPPDDTYSGAHKD
jgi:hypothetical protein